MAGWISIHRKIQNHWVWDEKPFDKRSAWIDLILSANYKENKFLLGNELIEVERGSFITSEVKLSERWGWSRTKVRNFLGLLEKDNMIQKKSSNKRTALTIVNYNDYQIQETSKEHQKNIKKTSKEHQKNTNNKDNKDNKNNKDTTTMDQNLENDELVAQVDADSTKQENHIKSIEQYYLHEVRKQTMCSSKDMIDIVAIVKKYQDVDFILDVLQSATKDNIKRNGKCKINSFSYFIPILEDRWEEKNKEVELGEPTRANSKKSLKYNLDEFLWTGES